MDFAFSDRAEGLRSKLNWFMDDHVIPRHADFLREHSAGMDPISFMPDLKALAKSEGLWNLFLPSLRDDEPGTRLSNLDYAPLAEIMGQLTWASEVFNCSAPDTGNMELLHLFATEEQRRRWLDPLLNGEIRSCFAMTEPDVASSDATNITTSIRRDGDDYLINGRKWFITGAMRADCKVSIVMGKTDFEAEPHKQQSMVIVPMDTPGVQVVRDLTIMHHHSFDSHCEIVYRDVRVPRSNLLGEEGAGFALAQARLGPGRIHHCMRSIGQAEVALKLMVDRVKERKTFGKFLKDHGMIQEMIARSRMEIEQARLLVLKAAWMIDKMGAKSARNEIAMIKVAIPQMQLAVTNRAIQIFGGMGLSPDTPLPELWTMARTLQIADGPDQVHLRSIFKGELKRDEGNAPTSHRFLTSPDRAQERDMRPRALHNVNGSA